MKKGPEPIAFFFPFRVAGLDNADSDVREEFRIRRFKDDAREVASGFECGIGLEGFDDIQVGDQLEVIEIVEVARKLGAS